MLHISNRTSMMYRIATLTAVGITALMSMVPAAAAQSSDAKALLMVSPANGTFTVGAIIPVDVLLDTKGVSVSQVDFKLKYDPEYLEVQDSDSTRTGLQIKDGDLFEVLLSTAPVDTAKGIVQYSKIALSDNKYYQTSGQPGKVATINFKALKEGDTSLKFDTTKVGATEPTKVYRSSDEVQVLDEVTNGDYEIQAGNGSSATSSASPTPTATSSPSSTASATPSANARPSLLMTLDHSSLQANGRDKAQVRVILKDRNGDPLANTKVNLTVDGSALIDPTFVTTDTRGQAIATLTAGTQAGSITVNAQLDSNPSVTATSQLNSTVAAVATPASTPTTVATPSAMPRPTTTARPTSVPAPDELDQVGPGSLAIGLIVSALAAMVVLRRKETVNIKVK